MEQLSLDGIWQLIFFPEGAHTVEGLADLQRLEPTAIPARVPGNVELDLVRAGLLPDPFVGRNILQLAPYEHYEWWYRRSFTTPAAARSRYAALRFDGLDCCATIRLNGTVLSRTANMLIAHVLDVTGILSPEGETNDLVVRIVSPTRVAANAFYDPNLHALPSNFESLRIRKAPHMYGWDIAPRAVSAGIWRSVRLQFLDDVSLGDPYYFTRRPIPSLLICPECGAVFRAPC